MERVERSLKSSMGGLPCSRTPSLDHNLIPSETHKISEPFIRSGGIDTENPSALGAPNWSALRGREGQCGGGGKRGSAGYVNPPFLQTTKIFVAVPSGTSSRRNISRRKVLGRVGSTEELQPRRCRNWAVVMFLLVTKHSGS